MNALPPITFVASLPRSRSAWVANLLTHGGSFAYHEPLRWDGLATNGGPPDYRALAAAAADLVSIERVCFCDTAFGSYWKAALEAFPEARVLILWRPAGEAVRSWNAAAARWGQPELAGDEGLRMYQLEAGLSALAWHCDRQGVRTLNVPVRKLDEPGTVGKVWDFCAPGLPFDERRARMLMDLQVEARMPAYIETKPGQPPRVRHVQLREGVKT